MSHEIYIYINIYQVMLMVLVTVKLFSEKYKHLYNSVPYNIDDMHAIESTIFERLHNSKNVKYVISHSNVINAESHLKNDFTLFYLFYTPCFYRMVLAQIQ